MRQYLILPLSLATLLSCLFTACSDDTPEPTPGPVVETIYGDLDFNQWIYAAMNRQYLWREDLPDSLDCDYELSPRDFFYSLLSDKDRFSYFTSNPYYNPTESATQSGSLGFEYQEFRDAAGRKALNVLYVTAPEAHAAGLRRGDFVAVENAGGGHVSLRRVACRNAAFSPTDESLEYAVDATRAASSSSVLLDSIYTSGAKKIGYLCYLQYDSPSDLYPALGRFASEGISELILDLRYNPGGYVSTCKYLCNSIVPASGYDQIFQQCSYNSVLAAEYLQSTGSERTFSYFTACENRPDILGSEFNFPLQLPRLIVLTSTRTASASEATVVCLRPYMDIVLIGETTIGKGVGSWTIYNSQFRYALQPITMRYYNSLGETTPDSGLTPDITVEGGYTTARAQIGETTEPLLNEALHFIAPEGNWGAPDSSGGNLLGMPSASGAGLTPVGEPSYMEAFRAKGHN
ncbi:MAG: hypothetical protein K2L83_05130 [Muribaculaceae bacterium]|nr:hypothetical protein [Muribaculaceae bacterium]